MKAKRRKLTAQMYITAATATRAAKTRTRSFLQSRLKKDAYNEAFAGSKAIFSVGATRRIVGRTSYTCQVINVNENLSQKACSKRAKRFAVRKTEIIQNSQFSIIVGFCCQISLQVGQLPTFDEKCIFRFSRILRGIRKRRRVGNIWWRKFHSKTACCDARALRQHCGRCDRV